ncbi:MAG: ring-hydroxylating oxygenase subunit alpha [Xanthobacteraceae bacterium]|nr:ring-hydroxylating oxygenase subunit alpha [Xanthobacteraceae bacterium]
MLAHPDLGFVDDGVDFLEDATYGACRARFGIARGMPRQAYTSAVFQDLENEKVWTRDWICIGTTPEIADAGDLLPYTVGQHGIHVQRLDSGGLIGRFNKAQHGGCRSIPAQCMTGRKTRCSYTSCGHSRDRGVITGSPSGEMTPQMGQYLGGDPERLLRVAIVTSGPFIFANVDPTLGRKVLAPNLEAELDGDAERVEGQWQDHHANWKLAGAALVDAARSPHHGGGAVNHISAEWHFPNLVLIKTRSAVLAIVLQPTGFDQALWRLSFFRAAHASDAAYDGARERLLGLLERAAAKAVSDQARAQAPTIHDVTEQSRAAWKFNQELLQRINARHVSYWNAPLTSARAGL